MPAGQKIAWFGPPMSPTSMATARLMETWAHGQDVADALGVKRQPSNRLKHVAHLAVRTRDFAYLLNDRQPPAGQFHVELTGPDGDSWTWGPEDAEQRVSGPALDFCLLATQRRHRDDLDVRADGAQADEWLGIIQAFAGMPGKGRRAAGSSHDNSRAAADPDRERLGVLRRPVQRLPGDADRRAARRADRRLSGRADDAHPRAGPAEGSVARLREDLPQAARDRPRRGARPRRQGGQQRGRTEPGRSRAGHPGARGQARPAPQDRVRRRRRPAPASQRARPRPTR